VAEGWHMNSVVTIPPGPIRSGALVKRWKAPKALRRKPAGNDYIRIALREKGGIVA